MQRESDQNSFLSEEETAMPGLVGIPWRSEEVTSSVHELVSWIVLGSRLSVAAQIMEKGKHGKVEKGDYNIACDRARELGRRAEKASGIRMEERQGQDFHAACPVLP